MNYFIYKKVRNVDIDLVDVGEPLEDEKNVEEENKNSSIEKNIDEQIAQKESFSKKSTNFKNKYYGYYCHNDVYP